MQDLYANGNPDVRYWIQLSRPCAGDVGEVQSLHSHRHKVLFPAPFQPEKGWYPDWVKLAYFSEPVIQNYLECPFWDISVFRTSADFIHNVDVDTEITDPFFMEGMNEGFNYNIPYWFRLDTHSRTFRFPAPCQPFAFMNGDPEEEAMARNARLCYSYPRTFGEGNFRQFTSSTGTDGKRADIFVPTA